MTHPSGGRDRILTRMCVVIAVNQLGFLAQDRLSLAIALATDLFGPDPALAITALRLGPVALPFARFAPGIHRPRAF